jgi:hypothetical protein
MRAPLSTAIAIGSGLLVLAGAFLPIPALQAVRGTLLGWAVIVAGVAGLIAIFNLLGVHWRRLNTARNRDFYSLFFLLAFVITFVIGFVLGPDNANFQKVVTHIQIPVEASLMAVLTVSLTMASIRMFRRRTGWMPYLFAGSAIVFLIISSGYLSVGQNLPLVKDALAAINTLPVAGARGILLGIALGSLTAGIRVLIGADRPYSG